MKTESIISFSSFVFHSELAKVVTAWINARLNGRSISARSPLFA